MMHWPVGTIRQQFIPTGTGTSYTTSKTAQGPGYIISPFDTPELRPHTIALHGFHMRGISAGQGGGHESGTPMATTGANCPGTRDNQGEDDDGCAGGPSWDQLLLKNVPNLARRDAQGAIIGPGYANAICDARIDSYETSTRTLSYSYTRQQIASARPAGMITENAPNPPTLAPLELYNRLFMGFTPGGTMSDENAIRLLKQRRSALDYSIRELERMGTLVSQAERVKIDAHAEAIRKIERDLSDKINNSVTGTLCMLPPMPPRDLKGGASSGDPYGDATASKSDETIHEQIGQAHAGIIRAAFACDIIRVATFQWSPGTNHVSFKGLDPNAPNTIYMHHPLSHKVGSPAFYNGSRPTTDAYVWDAMVNANRWYFQKTADIINQFRTQADAMGNNLLDHTVIPMVTEVAEAGHSREGHAALVFGGRALGMQGGQYQSVDTLHNSLWLSVAQAYLGANPATALASEAFVKSGANPIAGLWRAQV
jgi:hypothetical protein